MSIQQFIQTDSKVALMYIYLWLLFGYLSSMMSCNLQKWMK